MWYSKVLVKMGKVQFSEMSFQFVIESRPSFQCHTKTKIRRLFNLFFAGSFHENEENYFFLINCP